MRLLDVSRRVAKCANNQILKCTAAAKLHNNPFNSRRELFLNNHARCITRFLLIYAVFGEAVKTVIVSYKFLFVERRETLVKKLRS